MNRREPTPPKRVDGDPGDATNDQPDPGAHGFRRHDTRRSNKDDSRGFLIGGLVWGTVHVLILAGGGIRPIVTLSEGPASQAAFVVLGVLFGGIAGIQGRERAADSDAATHWGGLCGGRTLFALFLLIFVAFYAPLGSQLFDEVYGRYTHVHVFYLLGIFGSILIGGVGAVCGLVLGGMSGFAASALWKKPQETSAEPDAETAGRAVFWPRASATGLLVGGFIGGALGGILASPSGNPRVPALAIYFGTLLGGIAGVFGLGRALRGNTTIDRYALVWAPLAIVALAVLASASASPGVARWFLHAAVLSFVFYVCVFYVVRTPPGLALDRLGRLEIRLKKDPAQASEANQKRAPKTAAARGPLLSLRGLMYHLANVSILLIPVVFFIMIPRPPNLDLLRKGMTYQEVVSVLGEPGKVTRDADGNLARGTWSYLEIHGTLVVEFDKDGKYENSYGDD